MSNDTEAGAAALVKVLQDKLQSAEDEIARLDEESKRKARDLHAIQEDVTMISGMADALDWMLTRLEEDGHDRVLDMATMNALSGLSIALKEKINETHR